MSHYVLICGGRDYKDREAVAASVAFLELFYGEDLRVMHGAAPGADTLAKEEAVKLGVKVKAFPADWDQYGKPAGMIRNREMADYLVMCRSKGHSVQVVAFPGGTGTNGMVMEAESRGIDVDRH